MLVHDKRRTAIIYIYIYIPPLEINLATIEQLDDVLVNADALGLILSFYFYINYKDHKDNRAM